MSEEQSKRVERGGSCRGWGVAWVLAAVLGLQPAQAQTDVQGGGGEASGELTEKAFWEDVPVVLSVSRLPQRLDETPGAVTVIDRETIRLSGARDVADLLRLVPGFRVTNSFESNAPLAGYHWIAVEDYVNRMLVMVDGRSVYSPYFLGSVGVGLQSVALEDIERIEVLRGTGSAAYGARAFLGTINIVTRDPTDTLAVYAHAAAGENAVRDSMVRVGGGTDDLHYRLSLDQRFDGGLTGSGGSDRVRRLNLRADLRLTADDQLALRAGHTMVKAGVGYANQDGNALRERAIDMAHVQFDWRHSLAEDDELALQVSRTQERAVDAFGYLPDPRIEVALSGQASSDNLLLQHSLHHGQAVRLVWGVEARREWVKSRPLFDTDAVYSTDFLRTFGNIEWRLRHDLLLNAGALVERSTMARRSLAPRAMLNWKVTPEQTVRLGVSRGMRAPSLFEKYANTRFYLGGNLVESTYVSRGNLHPETMVAREVGYLLSDYSSGSSLDLRLFREDVRGPIQHRSYDYAAPWLDGAYGDGKATDAVNDADFRVQGAEYQFKLRPWRDAQLIWSQSLVVSSQGVNSQIVGTAQPEPQFRSMALMFSQQLRDGSSLSLQYYRADPHFFVGEAMLTAPMHRTDLRLARPWRGDRLRGEVSLVVQNLEGPYPDYVPAFAFPRRAYLMLRLEP